MTAHNPPSSQKPARVRFAPSPTGLTHLGSARTALYNYLLARQTGGQFILRFEDTDRKRFIPEAEDDLVDSLHWLGMEWDAGPDVGGPHAPYRQSERKEIYRQYAEELVDKGAAFYCFCTPEKLAADRQEQQVRKEQPHYAGTCRNLSLAEAKQRVEAGEPHTIRFKTPKDGTVTGHDHLRGDITVENRNIDDYILVKSDGNALYHLAAMVDDHLMGITHVFRGEEWLATFPLHVHIYQAFGWEQPEWVHLSVFLKPTGKGKMSKRETEQMKLSGQSIFIKDMEALGYLPEGVVNWIALMGWSYDDKTEFFTMADLIAKFDIDRLNPSAAAIDFKKLDHFNELHIRALSAEELARRMLPFVDAPDTPETRATLVQAAPLLQPRLTTLDETQDWLGFLFNDEIRPELDDLIDRKLDAKRAAEALRAAHDQIQALPDFNHGSLEAPLRALAEELGLKAGQLFGMLRAAVTGQRVSPPLFESMEILGRDKVSQRLQSAIELLED